MPTHTPRRVLSDALISTGTLAFLVLVLVSVDDRVREYAQQLTTGAAAGDLSGISGVISDTARVLADVAWDQINLHTPLMIFVVAGTVLFLFMIRT
jgi:hypothetical protein